MVRLADPEEEARLLVDPPTNLEVGSEAKVRAMVVAYWVVAGAAALVEQAKAAAGAEAATAEAAKGAGARATEVAGMAATTEVAVMAVATEVAEVVAAAVEATKAMARRD